MIAERANAKNGVRHWWLIVHQGHHTPGSQSSTRPDAPFKPFQSGPTFAFAKRGEGEFLRLPSSANLRVYPATNRVRG